MAEVDRISNTKAVDFLIGYYDLRAIDHFVLFVLSIETTVEFYRRGFGLQPRPDLER